MKNVNEKGVEIRKRMKRFIILYIQEHSYPPTFKEIGSAVGLKSYQSVKNHMDKMFESGELETDAGCGNSRAIRVPAYEFVKLDELQRCSRPLPTKYGYMQMVYK